MEIYQVEPVDAKEASVCSACSGDYAGGFEDSGEPMVDLDHRYSRQECPGSTEERTNHPGDGGMGSFEDQLNQWNSRSESLTRAASENGGEICEIFVSATRIIEIREVRANSQDIREFRSTGREGMSAAAKHSEAASAKYYQTRTAAAEVTSRRSQVACCHCVAELGAKEFANWFKRVLGRWRKMRR